MGCFEWVQAGEMQLLHVAYPIQETGHNGLWAPERGFWCLKAWKNAQQCTWIFIFEKDDLMPISSLLSPNSLRRVLCVCVCVRVFLLCPLGRALPLFNHIWGGPSSNYGNHYYSSRKKWDSLSRVCWRNSLQSRNCSYNSSDVVGREIKLDWPKIA